MTDILRTENAVQDLEQATDKFKEIMTTEQASVDVPGVGQTPSLKARVDAALQEPEKMAVEAANNAKQSEQSAATDAQRSEDAALRAEQAISQTVIWGGDFTPKPSNEYPDTSAINKNTEFKIKLDRDQSYTFTEGQLTGIESRNLDTLIFETKTQSFLFIPSGIKGAVTASDLDNEFEYQNGTLRSGNWSAVAGAQLTEADRYKAWDYPDDSGDRYAVHGNVALPITIPAAPDERFYLASSATKSYVDKKPTYNTKNTSANPLYNAGAVVVIGDSISFGADASSYDKSYMYQFLTSIGNGVDDYFGRALYLSVENFIAQKGVTTTGAIVSGGVTDYRLRLSAGQNLNVTNFDMTYADITYDSATTTATQLIVTITHGDRQKVFKKALVSGIGIKTTFGTLISELNLDVIGIDDIVTFEVDSGYVDITSIITFKHSDSSPILFTASRGGWAFQDFNVDRINDLAAHVNLFKLDKEKVVVIALGTNNIYSASVQSTVAQYMAELEGLISRLKSSLQKLSVIVSVPAKASSQWGSAEPYEWYVSAIIDFCNQNNYSMVRNDLCDYNGLTSDGLHPNDVGHSMMAQTFCDALRVPFSPTPKVLNNQYQNVVHLYESWEAQTAYTGPRVLHDGLGVSLTGTLQPKPEANNIIGVIPLHLAPRHRDVYMTVWTNSQIAVLKIDTNGNLYLLDDKGLAFVPSSFVVLDGSTWVI